MPAESEAVVAMEKPATVAAIGERAEEEEATKRPSSGTATAGRTCTIAAENRRAWVITKCAHKLFFRTPVIAQAATKGFNEAGARHCSDSARMNAGGRWNACWSASDDGGNAARHVPRK